MRTVLQTVDKNASPLGQ